MARKDPEFEAMEELLKEAWTVLRASPDRERGFLSSGSRSGWPEVVRDRVMDYADADAQPRLRIGRREVALRDAVFVDPGCLMDSVAPANKPLVALVLSMKTRHEPGGFTWERVWECFGAYRSGTTTDALRMRYGRVVRDLAALWATRSAAELAAVC
jgi:hypothetical protein